MIRNSDDAYNQKIRDRNDALDREDAERLKNEYRGDEGAMRYDSQGRWTFQNTKKLPTETKTRFANDDKKNE